MIIELALIIIIVIILITEFLKYVQLSPILNGRTCGKHNQESFKQDMEYDANTQKLIQHNRKLDQTRQLQIKKANNPTEISEDTLFSHNMGSGVSLKYW